MQTIQNQRISTVMAVALSSLQRVFASLMSLLEAS
jgi:hypothetical protein